MPEVHDHNWSFIDGFARLFEYHEQLGQPPDPGQQQYWAWQRDVVQRVYPVSWKQVLSHPAKDLARFVKKFKPKKKECYNNAINASLTLGCDYIEGYLFSKITMHHCWNAFDDDHFDLTIEEGSKKLPLIRNGELQYSQIIRLHPEELEEYLDNTNQDIVPWMGMYFHRHVLKDDKSVSDSEPVI